MTTPTRLKATDHMSREEIEARLEASEARVSLAHQGIHHKMDMVIEKLDHIKTTVPDLHAHVSKLRDEVKEDYKFTRWSIAAIILACVGALWVTQSNLIAALAVVKG